MCGHVTEQLRTLLPPAGERRGIWGGGGLLLPANKAVALSALIGWWRGIHVRAEPPLAEAQKRPGGEASGTEEPER